MIPIIAHSLALLLTLLAGAPVDLWTGGHSVRGHAGGRPWTTIGICSCAYTIITAPIVAHRAPTVLPTDSVSTAACPQAPPARRRLRSAHAVLQTRNTRARNPEFTREVGGQNSCRQTAKVVDADQQAPRLGGDGLLTQFDGPGTDVLHSSHAMEVTTQT